MKILETNIIDGKVDIDEEAGSIYYQPNNVYNLVQAHFPCIYVHPLLQN